MERQEAEALYRHADRLFCSGKLHDALTCLDNLRQTFPDDRRILYATARCFAGMGKMDEAAALCHRLIEEHGYDRAHQLLGELGRKPPTVPSEEPGRPGASSPSGRARRILRWGLLSAMGVAGALLVVALAYPVLYERAGDSPRKSARDRNERPRRIFVAPLNAVEPEVPAGPQGPIEHPQHIWEKTAINGVPDWKSGIYRRVPGITSPTWTIDVFLPSAYDEYPEKYFPCVIIQMAEGNPGFQGLTDWAEQSEVILVALNESKNRARGHLYYNEIAQEQALATIVQNMRLDLRLGFAIGTSGGGKSSWHLVSRYPQNFQGLVMMAMSHDGKSSYIPPHVRIAYIHGESDFNNPSIARIIPRMIANGNQVRELVIPGGHVSGRPEDIMMMLEWMVSDARRSFGIPNP